MALPRVSANAEAAEWSFDPSCLADSLPDNAHEEPDLCGVEGQYERLDDNSKEWRKIQTRGRF